MTVLTPETLYLLLRCFGINATLEQTRETTVPERNMIWQWACAKFEESYRGQTDS